MLHRAPGTSVPVRHGFKARRFAAASTFRRFAQRQSHAGLIVRESAAAGSPSDADRSEDSASLTFAVAYTAVRTRSALLKGRLSSLGFPQPSQVPVRTDERSTAVLFHTPHSLNLFNLYTFMLFLQPGCFLGVYYCGRQARQERHCRFLALRAPPVNSPVSWSPSAFKEG